MTLVSKWKIVEIVVVFLGEYFTKVVPPCTCTYTLGLPPTQDASHPPGLWTIFSRESLYINLHLPLASWVGGRSNLYLCMGYKGNKLRQGYFLQVIFPQWNSVYIIILLMEEILHHLGCIKPCKWWDYLPINWCRISSINSRILKGGVGDSPNVP